MTEKQSYLYLFANGNIYTGFETWLNMKRRQIYLTRRWISWCNEHYAWAFTFKSTLRCARSAFFFQYTPHIFSFCFLTALLLHRVIGGIMILFWLVYSHFVRPGRWTWYKVLNAIEQVIGHSSRCPLQLWTR